MFCNNSSLIKNVISRIVQIRTFYGVQHSAKREIFYVRLKDETAVLTYKADGRILDMKSIRVPRDHQGRGLARLLAEAAFTYAIVHDFYMILSCKYMQKLYLATKNAELEERVIGPKYILDAEAAAKFDPDTVYNLPDPEDSSTDS